MAAVEPTCKKLASGTASSSLSSSPWVTSATAESSASASSFPFAASSPSPEVSPASRVACGVAANCCSACRAFPIWSAAVTLAAARADARCDVREHPRLKAERSSEPAAALSLRSRIWRLVDATEACNSASTGIVVSSSPCRTARALRLFSLTAAGTTLPALASWSSCAIACSTSARSACNCCAVPSPSSAEASSSRRSITRWLRLAFAVCTTVPRYFTVESHQCCLPLKKLSAVRPSSSTLLSRFLRVSRTWATDTSVVILAAAVQTTTAQVSTARSMSIELRCAE
mmetsp:Transcript_55926/g.121027  ORF Transcript_55926/g.121027 Transcript_55926/m.121027 type:complete len:287 (+) Transcript_55926:1051-1911(+)